MRILHVDTQVGWRGGEQQLFLLVENLIKMNISTAIACKKNDELYRRCKEKGIKTVPLSGNQLLDSLKIAYIGKKFDVIHAHAAKAHTVCAFGKLFNKKSLVYTRRVDYKPKDNPITFFKYRNTNMIVAISEFVAKTIKAYIGTDISVKVIYSAVDTKLKNRVDDKKVLSIKDSYKGNIIVGSVAALTDQKNIPNLIKAATYVIKQYPKTQFIVLGQGRLKANLENMIKIEGLDERFKLVGFKRDIENYIKAFDIFVLPSDFEGLGSSILSAMILNVPVVATDAGGVREAVINNKTGLLIPRNNPTLLANAILNIMENSQLREYLTRHAYEFIISKFSVEHMVDKYLQIYGTLLNNH